MPGNVKQKSKSSMNFGMQNIFHNRLSKMLLSLMQ